MSRVESPPGATLYAEPAGLTGGLEAARAVAGGQARWLAGGPLGFSQVRLHARSGAVRSVGVAQCDAASIEPLSRPRVPLGDLDWTRARVMGIVNVTPDSFSDGGLSFTIDSALARGRALWQAGAAILDIGGESTRPGAAPVAVEEELRRVIPVVRALAQEGARVSIDTRKARVMAAALDAGAVILNDVSALTHDPDSLAVAVDAQLPVILMHMRGEPHSMQRAPQYDHAPIEVFDELAAQVARCIAAGLPHHLLLVDPGIGFAKLVAHNLALLAHIGLLHGLGCPIVLGVSRKRFISQLSREEPAEERLPGSLAAALSAAAQGVQILRVHDVAETCQALAVWQAIQGEVL